MDWQTAMDVLAAGCAACAPIGACRLQRQDCLTGRVPPVESAHNAHVNAAGLHDR